MNPLVTDILGSFLRKGLTAAGTWLVSQGWLDSGEVEHYVAGFTLLGVSVLLSLWDKYKTRLVLLTAIDMPGGTPEATVRRMAQLDPPSVSS